VADTHRLDHWGPFFDGRIQAAATARTFPVVDPSVGEPFAQVAEAGPEGVDRAVRAAEKALPAWRDLKPLERGRAIARVSATLLAQVERLARLETQNTGKPL